MTIPWFCLIILNIPTWDIIYVLKYRQNASPENNMSKIIFAPSR